MNTLKFVEFLLQFVGSLAAKTPTLVDDAVVALLVAIKDDPVVRAWFEGKAAAAKDKPAGVLSLELDDVPLEVQESLAEFGLGGDLLKQALQFLLDLFLKWINRPTE